MTFTLTLATASKATQKQVTQAIADGFKAPVHPERALGCCRVYVSVSKADATKVKKACEALGVTFRRNIASATNMIYCGYDNCDGVALARGTAVEKALKAAGLSCYRELPRARSGWTGALNP